jgi:putative membrane protein
MPSEQRLHPLSVLFVFGRSLKAFALPALIVLLTGRSVGPGGSIRGVSSDWELWITLLLIPSLLVALLRYLSFRLRYEAEELVIRTGILFRNERHVPYARIQNIDAVQNVVHRFFDVVEVRVETGGGREAEATLSVLPASALAEMRRRVFEGRESAAALEESSQESASRPETPEHRRTLLHLPVRELLLLGFLENRGLVLMGALYGVLWEVGLLDIVWDRIFEGASDRQDSLRAILTSLARGRGLTPQQLAIGLGGIAGLLIFVRVVSMAWAVIRLYEFRLTRDQNELHTAYGLFTRVTATIPLRRVQAMTITESPLNRLLSRVSLSIETAGGRETNVEGRSRKRELLAPIVATADLRALAREVMPEAVLEGIQWQPVHPRAVRRAMTRYVFWAIVLSGLSIGLLGRTAVGLASIMVPVAIFAARRHVRHLGWAADDEAVAFKTGWLWRTITIARVSKIQAVTVRESPFDRRASMARLRVDTAGAGTSRVDIPYLARETARGLHDRLAVRAAETAFRW